jgi:hypothetical protein
MQCVPTFLGGKKLQATATIAAVVPPPNNKKYYEIKEKTFMEINPLVKKCKMKLLLDLHDARPAPTEPGCRPA